MTKTGKTVGKYSRAGKHWTKINVMMTWLHINNLDQSCLFISDSKQSIFLDDISGENQSLFYILE